MRRSRIAEFLLAAGAVVGAAAVVGLVVGFEPAKLPPALLNLAFYKLAFVGAAGLLVGGGLVHRYARRGEGQLHTGRAADSVREPQAALGDGAANPPASTLRDERAPLNGREDG